MNHQKKYIVVGQGLVGSILGFKFIQQNVPFKIFSNGVNHTTKVAAGLINPMVFKRLNKCFGADITIPAAYSFYHDVETLTSSKFMYKKEYCRIFASIEEENNWLVKQNQPEFTPHIYPLKEPQHENLHDLETKFGQGFVKNAGFMHTEDFLDTSEQYFNANQHLVKESFDYNVIDQYIAEGYEIIFCEGYLSNQNPYFKYLPLNTTQGDIIDIEQTDKKIDCIINKGVFVLPLKENILRIGSTYQWNVDDPTPTTKGRLELEEKIKVLDGINYKVVQHRAGIRPTVKDRRPLIGTHPVNKKLHIINGMGTRGVALAPHCVDQFLDSIQNGTPLPDEVNIRRFDNELNVD
jgi:hypothetical protein